LDNAQGGLFQAAPNLVTRRSVDEDCQVALPSEPLRSLTN